MHTGCFWSDPESAFCVHSGIAGVVRSHHKSSDSAIQACNISLEVRRSFVITEVVHQSMARQTSLTRHRLLS